MPENNTAYQDRLLAFHEQLQSHGLDGFIVPHTDEYQSEFLAAYAERLAWLTGFTGSAGTAVVTTGKSVVMTDGRYTIQVKKEVHEGLYETLDSTRVSVGQWLKDNAKEGSKIGFDPWLHTPADIEKIKETAGHKVELCPVEQNPIDVAWTDQPGKPMNPVEKFPDDIAGKTAEEKIEDICTELREEGVDACLITLPDSICWLLNIRGRDQLYNPVTLAHAILKSDGQVELLIDPRKITPPITEALGDKVHVFAPSDREARMNALSGKKVQLDPKKTPLWFENRLRAAGATIINKKDPCILPKACKTPAEIQAIKNAHILDAIAVIQVLRIIDELGAKGKLTEIEIDEHLQAYRAQQFGYQGPSFPTIAGFGENGAIIHYRAKPETNTRIEPDGLLLVDSGGQYMWGTTDITRTVAIGKPTEEMKTRNTLVLKGHIAVARARFPEGTTGIQIDTLARKALWEQGLDYAHGTGHGVGCYLSVHEEAASLSPRGTSELKAGMLISNEPGYYKEEEYGIRIENLILVKESGEETEKQKPILEFETVSLVPFDPKLIDRSLLTPEELDWLRSYYTKINEVVMPRLGQHLQTFVHKMMKPFLD